MKFPRQTNLYKIALKFRRLGWVHARILKPQILTFSWLFPDIQKCSNIRDPQILSFPDRVNLARSHLTNLLLLQGPQWRRFGGDYPARATPNPPKNNEKINGARKNWALPVSVFDGRRYLKHFAPITILYFYMGGRRRECGPSIGGHL